MLDGGRVLIGSVYMCPPVIIHNGYVADLQAAEALLPAVRVLCGGVSKVAVKGSCCLSEDFEVFDVIWAKGS